jgi:hypothetical protein
MSVRKSRNLRFNLCKAHGLSCVTVPDPSLWRTIAELAQLERIWLRPTLNEVCDMQWSPDSTHLVIGAIDSKVSCHAVEVFNLTVLLHGNAD